MSISANETILRAKQMYILAQQRGDQHGMELAHQMAETARLHGGTIGANQTLAQTIQVVQQENYQRLHVNYSVPVPHPTYSVVPTANALHPSPAPAPTSTYTVKTSVSVNSAIVQHALDEIGRAQQAYDEYMKAGRQDLADSAHQYAEQQRANLRNLGVSDSYYNSSVDLRNRYTGSGPAGVNNPTNGQVHTTTGQIPTTTPLSNPVQSTQPSPTNANQPVALNNQNVQHALDEIGRAQAAFDEYMKAGRQDLADAAHAYADQQRKYLQQLGLDSKYYDASLDLRWRYTGTSAAGQYDTSKAGSVTLPTGTSPVSVSTGTTSASGSAPNTGSHNINDADVQHLLDEIGRAQAAYDEYMKAGRADLANETHLYADQQRATLKK